LLVGERSYVISIPAMSSARTPPRATFQEQVLDQIGRDICAGRYRPGGVLPSEGELCERFGYSRIVIREAVKSLAAKGMLDVRRKVGTLVQDPAQWNLFDPDIISWRVQAGGVDRTMSRDLMELRRIVEPAAARLAARRASEAERLALRTAFDAMVKAVAGEGDYVTADLAFHTVVLSAGGNQFLRQMQVAMNAILRASFEIVSQKPGGPAHSLPLHAALCQAIEQGEETAAERATLRLIEQGERDLLERLDLRVA
jgi:DNA-binding FadR family transcriptional regulator